MKFANLITMPVIGLGAILVCLALTSLAYGVDTRFASGKSALAIPFELVDDHIYVRVRIDNFPPVSFVLDTGAPVDYPILSLRIARAWGLGLRRV